MDCVVEGSNPSHKFCDSMGLYGNSVGRVHKKTRLKIEQWQDMYRLRFESAHPEYAFILGSVESECAA